MSTHPPLTITQAAAAIGCNPRTVSRWAKALGLGTRLGTVLALAPHEIEAIRKKKHPASGCPKFVAGNTMWKGRLQKKRPTSKKKRKSG